ncbi:MAG: hypothetical protein NTU44_09395 [Bacteroidetes bacterium]|nr:hypothetical protein [Bacteroidota bacterium]
MKTKINLVLFFLFLMGFSYQSMATTWYVRTDPNFLPDDNNFGNIDFLIGHAWRHISNAVNNPLVQPGDVILVANDGPYVENITWPTIDGITLNGYDIMYSGANTVIDGNAAGSVIVIISSGTAITNLTVIDGFDITNGYSYSDGGGIYMSRDVVPLLKNLNIKSNTAVGNGGGIYYRTNDFYVVDACNYWKPSFLPCSLVNVTVKGNLAADPVNGVGSGGGIYIEGNYQTDDPTCPEIYTVGPIMALNNCNINQNTCIINGGGICLINAGIYFNTGSINDNRGGWKGGGFYANTSVSVFYDVGIKYNTCMDGGGAYLEGGLTAHDVHCNDCSTFSGFEHRWELVELSGNVAFNNGGGVYVDGVNLSSADKYLDLVYTGTAICQNTAVNNGGGIYVYSAARLYLKDLIIYDNQVTNGDGGGIYNNCEWNANTAAGWTPEHYFEQLLIIENKSPLGYGGGIFTKQTFYCINSTIANNRGKLGGGATACFSYTGGMLIPAVRPVFYNSIIWGNVWWNPIWGWIFNQFYLNDDYCDPQFAYTDIQDFYAPSPPNPLHNFAGNGASGWINYGFTPMAAIWDQDPLFANNGYTLQPASQLINQGNNILTPCSGWPAFTSFTTFPWPFDLNGNTRICTNPPVVIDMGAYEFCAKCEPITSQTCGQSSEDYRIEIQPNPWQTGQMLEFKVFSPIKSLLSISITDLSGKTWFLDQSDVEGEKKLGYSETKHALMPGLYILHCIFKDEKGNENTINKKIIRI